MRTTCSKSLPRMSQSSQLILNKLPRSSTSKLTRIQNICTIMNYRLVSTFGSGSCVSSFGSSPKVETAAVSSFGLTQNWKLRTRFLFFLWGGGGEGDGYTFEPAQSSLRRHMKGSMVGKQGGVYIESRGIEYAQGLTNKFAK